MGNYKLKYNKSPAKIFYRENFYHKKKFYYLIKTNKNLKNVSIIPLMLEQNLIPGFKQSILMLIKYYIYINITVYLRIYCVERSKIICFGEKINSKLGNSLRNLQSLNSIFTKTRILHKLNNSSNKRYNLIYVFDQLSSFFNTNKSIACFSYLALRTTHIVFLQTEVPNTILINPFLYNLNSMWRQQVFLVYRYFIDSSKNLIDAKNKSSNMIFFKLYYDCMNIKTFLSIFYFYISIKL